MTIKRLSSTLLMILLLAGMFILAGPVRADKPVTVTRIVVSVDKPYCGMEVTEETEPEVRISTYSGDSELEEASDLITGRWAAQYLGGEFEPFVGVMEGDENYTVFVEMKLREGYELAEEPLWGTSDETAWVQDLILEEERIVLAVHIKADHINDYEHNETIEATCISTGTETFICGHCGRMIISFLPIDPDAHAWGDWTVLKESTTTEMGRKTRTCTLCGEEQTVDLPREYTEVYEPETSWAMSATIAWRADETVIKTAHEEQRPATAFVWIDEALNVYDRNGGLISKSIDAYVKSTSPTIIPAFCFQNEAEAKALKTWLQKTGLEDCFVVSSPQNQELVKDIAELLHVKAILDFTSVTEADRKTLAEMAMAVNGAHGKIVLLSPECATRENIRILQGICATVWVKTPSDLPTLLTLYTNGVNGVLVDDFSAAIEALAFFKDDAPTLLRIPRIFGHRGDPSNYAENTLESARGAFEEGADAIENDIQLSKDGQLFILHNSTLGSFFGQSDTTASDLTLDELKALQFDWDSEEYGIAKRNEVPGDNSTYGSLFGGKLYGEEEKYVYRIPTLREYLEEFKGKDVVHDTEIKTDDPKVLSALKALVDEYDAWDQVFTITFENSIMERMFREYPEISVGALLAIWPAADYLPYATYEELSENEGTEFALELLYTTLDQWNATYNPPCFEYGKSMVLAGRHRGLTVWPWTYEIESMGETFASDYLLGVNGMTLDQPWVASDYIVEILSEDLSAPSVSEIAKPQARTQAGELVTLDQAELVTIETNDIGTDMLMMWRYRAELTVNGESYGNYYLYSNPFSVKIEDTQTEAPTQAPTEATEAPTEPEAPDKGATVGTILLWILLGLASLAFIGAITMIVIKLLKKQK